MPEESLRSISEDSPRSISEDSFEIPFDKLHEECGIFAVYGHPEAANLAHLGLHALQHRGQESAGIASCDGKEIHCIKSLGHVADIFTASVLNRLPGNMAIGHTRYSTAGDSAALNAQPFSVACHKGRIAVAHNGNLTNAAELRSQLEETGSIFQATSDTEVILHLVARSAEKSMSAALREALLLIEGAFSLVFLAQDRVIVARDPHGFRPLAIGRMNLKSGPAYVFASETCAFDLIDAHYIGDVEPGEMVIAGPDGLIREFYTVPQTSAQCVFEHVYFSRPDSTVFGRSVQRSREMMGRLLANEMPVDA
ncbi:MAG: class II glutamine amidotransferase, partial [Acidobacteria bacterium]|nr:class II glutamine amidotransferase [Acidobacteriota bacterium]